MPEGGLLSSAEKHAITFSDSKTWCQASRKAIPQDRRAGILPDTPASAVLNSSDSASRCFLSRLQDPSREARSFWSTGTKYGARVIARTFRGTDASFPLLRVLTNKNWRCGTNSAQES